MKQPGVEAILAQSWNLTLLFQLVISQLVNDQNWQTYFSDGKCPDGHVRHFVAP